MTTQRNILIVEDDARSGALLAEFLQGQGYATTMLMSGLQVEPEVRRREPDLLLLDVTLPGMDGYEVCHRLRRFTAVPIIMLSGRCDELDRTLGLEMGADDYVCKPFSPREVAARVKALLRRAEGRLGADTLQGFRIDAAGQRIAWQDRWLPLTALEYRVLRRFVLRPGHVLTRDDLLDDGDAGARATDSRVIDTHVKNIRRKLEAAGAQACAITSIYGVGYRMDLVEELVC